MRIVPTQVNVVIPLCNFLMTPELGMKFSSTNIEYLIWECLGSADRHQRTTNDPTRPKFSGAGPKNTQLKRKLHHLSETAPEMTATTTAVVTQMAGERRSLNGSFSGQDA
jgi:hypothetical protein